MMILDTDSHLVVKQIMYIHLFFILFYFVVCC